MPFVSQRLKEFLNLVDSFCFGFVLSRLLFHFFVVFYSCCRLCRFGATDEGTAQVEKKETRKRNRLNHLSKEVIYSRLQTLPRALNRVELYRRLQQPVSGECASYPTVGSSRKNNIETSCFYESFFSFFFFLSLLLVGFGKGNKNYTTGDGERKNMNKEDRRKNKADREKVTSK